MPWYFYLAFKQLFPTGKRVTFFTVVSILGVILGVWLFILVTGVMGGFGHKYSQMIIETQGEVQIRGGAIEHYEDLQRAIEKIPGIAATTPTIEGFVMLQYGDKITFPAAVGVDVASVGKVIPLEKYMLVGHLADLDDDRIILSTGVQAGLGLQYLGAPVGIGVKTLRDKVTVITPRTLEKLNNDALLFPTDLEVIGQYEFGHQQLDKSIVVITLRRAQDLFGLDDAVLGINIRLKDGADAAQVASKINAMLPPGGGLRARTWMEYGEAFLDALRLEKIMVILIVSAVIIVVAFMVTMMLFVAVARKTREIGLYGALGASPWQSALCFCFQGVIVGAIGTLFGIGAGLLTLANLDPIVQFLMRLTGTTDLLEAVYLFTHVPAHLTTGNIVFICIYSIGMSTLAGLIAAWRAAKLKPVEAMRSE